MKRSLAAAVAVLALVASADRAGAGGARHEDSPIWDLPAVGAPVDGASASAVRTNGGVTITVDSSGFGANHAVTVWIFSFDHPENCDFGGPLPDGRTRLCGFGDDGADDTGFRIQQAAGHVLGGTGNANYGGHVSVVNPLGAELHVVLADHGPMDPAQLPEQIVSGAPGSQIAFFLP